MSTNAESGTPPAREPEAEPTAGREPEHAPATHAPVKRPKPDALVRSRTGYTWMALLAAAIFGIVLLIFILQNLDKVQVTLLFWSFSLPLGIMVLLSVILGALVMGLVGGIRILQLRHAARQP
ncbi:MULTISPECIES: lipopolysaccharide assembly protein LapA domain-containing protein [Nocardia]|uniref:LapA family protein n=1 Tax=Nocardia TaxID=1817 RepID=UPI0015EFC64F|nr:MULTISPECIES: lipopolysaccharide assembly protein LapA domain-containing protein [Nocardia]MCA2208115.1 lipopolysaccharide assembly protein LapA domain-containing protein [Nocardia rosealba]